MTGLRALNEYMTMARNARNPELAWAIVDAHFEGQDREQRRLRAVPAAIFPETVQAQENKKAQ